MKTPRVLETPPNWTPEEQPVLPGSPPNIIHNFPIRTLYFIIGIFVAISGALANGFITANMPQIQGEYGLTSSQAAWLPAVYVAANISSNLLLFKARQQFGLRWFTEVTLLAYMGIMLVHIFVQNYPMALIARGVSGFVGAPMSSLGMYYVMQAYSAKNRLQGLCIGFGASQLATPLAWIISPYLVEVNNWTKLYTFEFGLCLCCLAMVVALKLPRSLRVEVYEKKDLLTFCILLPAFTLLCGFLSQGSILWWRNAPSLAYMLIGAWTLLLIAFVFEHYRSSPLIMTRWLGTVSLLRFLVGAMLIRFIMSEQSFAVINFLKSQGLTYDQFVGFYTVVFMGLLAGILASAFTFTRERVLIQLMVAVFCVLIASIYDANMLTSDVRPQNFYFSQFLVAFASGMFISPLLLMGFGITLRQSVNHVVTFIILFNAAQSFGSLLGQAFYSTLQQERTQYHRQIILQQMESTDANVIQRLNQYQSSYRSIIPDKVLTDQQAQQTLNQIVTREAQIKAYSDVITVNTYIAMFLLSWGLINIGRSKVTTMREARGRHN